MAAIERLQVHNLGQDTDEANQYILYSYNKT